MYSKSNHSNYRNYGRRPNTSNRHSYRQQQPTDRGMQNFQSTLAQLNQINQMMLDNRKGNPMDMLNQFFGNPPK